MQAQFLPLQKNLMAKMFQNLVFLGWLLTVCGVLISHGPGQTMKKIAWSKLIRRTHMYLVLFLTPRVMVYGLVTFVLLVLTM